MGNLLQKFKFWIAKRTEQCKDVSPLLSDQLERKLGFWEQIRVKIHLWTCGPCTRYVSNLSFIHDIFKTQREKPEVEEFKVSLSFDAKERLKKSIESHK